MELPQDIMNYVKTFLPPHPLQKEINNWNLYGKQYFHTWFFDQYKMWETQMKIKKFVENL